MFNKTLLALILGIFAFGIQATTFQVLPLEKMIDESSSAAEVELKNKRSFMNPMGLILTEYTFSVLESYNLENGDLDGEYLKITMTGGTVDGVTSFIDGAPEFVIGEKSFLLLKKIDSKMYLSNFSMGKYKIIEHEGQTYYVSSVFPHDRQIGRVKKERMIELLRLKHKTTRAPEPDWRNLPAKQKTGSNKLFQKENEVEKRAPAQENTDAREPSEGLVAMWGFFILMSISGFVIWWKLKKGVRT